MGRYARKQRSNLLNHSSNVTAAAKSSMSAFNGAEKEGGKEEVSMLDTRNLKDVLASKHKKRPSVSSCGSDSKKAKSSNAQHLLDQKDKYLMPIPHRTSGLTVSDFGMDDMHLDQILSDDDDNDEDNSDRERQTQQSEAPATLLHRLIPRFSQTKHSPEAIPDLPSADPFEPTQEEQQERETKRRLSEIALRDLELAMMEEFGLSQKSQKSLNNNAASNPSSPSRNSHSDDFCGWNDDAASSHGNEKFYGWGHDDDDDDNAGDTTVNSETAENKINDENSHKSFYGWENASQNDSRQDSNTSSVNESNSQSNESDETSNDEDEESEPSPQPPPTKLGWGGNIRQSTRLLVYGENSPLLCIHINTYNNYTIQT
uniref:Uncharacterized protein n=1 Tax=Ditylum brightwellii TaxID=49249 RepID=A0A7S2EQP7_9STRA|mmetsp:Transcript_3935/g.6058  ORF Transcript_3935/g.6058 Transcript_3935/m.6058 type:complete len:372 (+) Transcript_3935:152-1267(+)